MLKDYQIKRIKEQYPKGTEIELISMEDSQAVPSGTHGIVDFVDDMGTIQMTWDNGSSLGLVVGEDQFKVIKKSKIKELSCSEVKELRDRNYEFLILQGCFILFILLIYIFLIFVDSFMSIVFKRYSIFSFLFLDIESISYSSNQFLYINIP